jgi:hypothetical protein
MNKQPKKRGGHQITHRQKELLDFVKSNTGLTTAEIRRKMGYKHQGYETPLRDRLFRLANRGLLHFKEKTGMNGLIVTERRWF